MKDKGGFRMLQVYTGNGKGKTTAAIGLAIRALGAGKKVYIMQFMKSLAYSEQKILAGLPNLCLETTGKPFFIAEEGMLSKEELASWGSDVEVFPKGKPPKEYVHILQKGLLKAQEDFNSGSYDMLILDEINVALFFGLIDKSLVESVLYKTGDVEIICTGRNAPHWLLEKADLVTEMKEIKHYYTRGIEARKGIEN
jgi:cob(I)alamin adenosyltransferase